MRKTILYAYFALLVAMALPYLASLGERDALAAGPLTALPEQSVTPEDQEVVAVVRPDESPPMESPGVAAAEASAPENIAVLLSDGSVQEFSLQDYLCGVVAAEMPASFEAEALKAQAVAARSYAMYCASFAKHGAAQVCTDSHCCQAWHSEAELKNNWGEQYETNSAIIREAVGATEGEYLSYAARPIFAAFHSSSAPMTEASEDLWSAVPYLVSVSSPETAESVPNYISTLQCSPLNFRDTVLSAHPECDFSTPEENWVGEAVLDGSGRVSTLTLGGVAIAGRELRQLFALRSTAFTLSYAEGQFTFTVTGFGHGVGMSQYGANILAQQGSSYREILAHYYPGTTLVK